MMKTPYVLLGAAMLGLAGCDSFPLHPPPPRGLAPMAHGTAMVTVGNKAPYGAFLVDGGGRSLYIL